MASGQNVGVDLDAAVVNKARQALPARQRITDRLRKLALLTDELEFFAQPGFKGFDERPAVFQPDDAPLIGVAAADGLLNLIEGPDFLQRFTGDQLDSLLLGNDGKPARERLTLVRLFEELRGLGYDIHVLLVRADGSLAMEPAHRRARGGRRDSAA